DSSARILSAYLTSIGIQAEYVNPKDAGIIVEKDPLGAKLLPESNNKIYELRKREGISIIPGFFGYTSTGELATFSRGGDRKSTRLNSSHVSISYAVFCLKKKKKEVLQT